MQLIKGLGEYLGLYAVICVFVVVIGWLNFNHTTNLTWKWFLTSSDSFHPNIENYMKKWRASGLLKPTQKKRSCAVSTSYFRPLKANWFPNTHSCINSCSPPSGVSGSAPESEWINNTKVWLDVWDPDSGFHFPYREPGRCPFRLPGNFFQEGWNNQTDEATNTDTLGGNKRVDSFFLRELAGKLTPRRRRRRCGAGPRRPDVVIKSGRSNSALCHRHCTHHVCESGETKVSWFPLREGILSSECMRKWCLHWHNTRLSTRTDSLWTL